MVSTPVLVQKALRQPPPHPDAPDVGDGLATPADYYGVSTIAVGWTAPAGTRVHVYRALDEAVFAADRAARAARSTVRADYPWLSDDAFAALVAQSPDYAALSDDLLQALASLPGNDAAFGLMTTAPLSSAPYRAALDGRSTNRYCIAVKLVDAAGNPSALSWPSRAVRAPKVRPPTTPVITKVQGGDRQIALTWASNREPDLKEYRVYRADTEAAAQDVRTMMLVYSVASGDLATRPAEITVIDQHVPALLTLYYRLMAVDVVGGCSDLSAVTPGRAFDETLPQPSRPAAAWVEDQGGALRARIVWSATDETILQQRPSTDGSWQSITGWLAPGAQTVIDDAADASNSYQYRLWARKPTGAVAIGLPVLLSSAS
jgi:hypothetical protein